MRHVGGKARRFYHTGAERYERLIKTRNKILELRRQQSQLEERERRKHEFAEKHYKEVQKEIYSIRGAMLQNGTYYMQTKVWKA